MDNVDNYIDKKTEEILSSPSYKNLTDKKKEKLQTEISNHLEKMVIETFINRLTDEQAEELNNLMQRKPKRAHEKLKELAFSTPELAEDVQARLQKEVEKFKSLKSNSHGEEK